MMDNQPNTTDPKKVFDISPPDQSVPSASGRPIIVSNKPEQTDQMVQLPTPTPEASPTPIQIVTAEPSEPAVPETTTQSTDLPVTDETLAPSPSVGTIIAPQTAAASDEGPETSIYAEPVTIDQQPAGTEGKVVTSQPAEAQPVPSAKQQVVVHKNPRSLGKSLFWIALIVLAIILVVDVLLDSGTISLNLPHTHFLGN